MNIDSKDLKKIKKYAENIYNISVVIDYFCYTQKEIEELYNLSPVIRQLRQEADSINAYFINLNID